MGPEASRAMVAPGRVLRRPVTTPATRLFATPRRRYSILAGVRHGEIGIASRPPRSRGLSRLEPFSIETHRADAPADRGDKLNYQLGCKLVTLSDQIEHAILTDVGVRRTHNQDNYAVLLASGDEQFVECGHLYLVADGMGAHAVGEKA